MLGYYAHGHGSGHCNYAQLIGNFFSIRDFLVFTDSDFKFNPHTSVVHIPNEHTNGEELNRAIFSEPPSLHYAPINLRKITVRNALMLKRVIEQNIKLLIIDVSVEVAMLARVSSIPYIYVRLMGVRNDAAHLNAFAGALFLLAYFPEEMEMDETPDWVRRKTVYLGFISKFLLAKKAASVPEVYLDDDRFKVLHLSGFGGSREVTYDLDPKKYFIVGIGPGRVRSMYPNVLNIGIVECTRAFIEHADIIVAACGSNTTSEILNLNRAFIAMSEERHYGEQRAMAKYLHRNKLAISLDRFTDVVEAVEAYHLLDDTYNIPNGWNPLLQFTNLIHEHLHNLENLVSIVLTRNEFKSTSPQILKI